MMKNKFAPLFLLFICFLAVFFINDGLSQQILPEEDQNKITQNEESHEKIIPTPANIKEKTGIYVFVAWIWFVIFVLIYVLIKKIREVDSLFQHKFFSIEKK